MARKDEILCSFLKHDLLTTKYNLDVMSLPNNVRDSLVSDSPIIKTIALIVEALESSPPHTDSTMRTQILQYLNEAPL